MAREAQIDTSVMLSMVASGKTHQEIADHFGVSRSSVSSAIHRLGRSRTQPRYDEELPWTVKSGHLREYPARMLRLLAKRRHKQPLSEADASRLDGWLAMLERENAVVGYDPDNPKQGFHYVTPQGDDGKNGIPIRRKTLKT